MSPCCHYSRHFSTITPNVFRFSPVRLSKADLNRIHGTNEPNSIGHSVSHGCVRLRNEDIDEARHQVAYHLVSRDVSKLDASKLSAATIESIAENTSDSVIAPLFYYAIGGLPAMMVYKMINTLDSMIGYKSDKYLLFGKFAAKLDDVANFIPARITARTRAAATVLETAISVTSDSLRPTR